jgi:hypothetical protein
MPGYVQILAGLIASFSLCVLVFYLAHSGLIYRETPTGAPSTPAGLSGHYKITEDVNWSIRSHNASQLTKHPEHTEPLIPHIPHIPHTHAQSSPQPKLSPHRSTYPTSTRAVVLDLKSALSKHPFGRLSDHNRTTMSLEGHFYFMSQQEECRDIPIFTSMANVFSDLYWQL